uniref:Uncharacterized protein n=1 Tax=Kalanchoe fedtschenkoi TaxID=63787 RepID=A0A7N0U901_KALFE
MLRRRCVAFMWRYGSEENECPSNPTCSVTSNECSCGSTVTSVTLLLCNCSVLCCS